MSLLAHLKKATVPAFLLSVLVIVLLGMAFMSTQNSADFTADISVSSKNEDVLLRAIQDKDFEYLISEFKDFTNIKAFFDDLETCTVIQDVLIDQMSTGFWLSFSCTTTGDSLHPYFGFFHEDIPKEVFWGVTPRGKILSVTVQEDEQIIAIENISVVPWNIKNVWLNSLGEEVVVSSESKGDEVLPRAGMILLTTAKGEISLLENVTHGFYLELE